MRIEGQTVLVTGATRGIGRALTTRLVAAGARVIAVGRTSAGGPDVGTRTRTRSVETDTSSSGSASSGGSTKTSSSGSAQTGTSSNSSGSTSIGADIRAGSAGMGSAVGPLGGGVVGWSVDLADAAAVDALIDEVTHRYPELSIVINNAAVQTETDLLSEDPRVLRPVLRREIAVNLDAVVALSAGLLPHLRSRSAAAIVNVTSGLAVAPKRSAPVYCATKAGVRTFTRAMRYQCERDAPHVRVSEVVLPLVDTDMTRGRGAGKITADAAAEAILTGLRRGTSEILVGKARLLPTIMRLAPGLGYRLLRNG